jgi:hypothetical protein
MDIGHMPLKTVFNFNLLGAFCHDTNCIFYNSIKIILDF